MYSGSPGASFFLEDGPHTLLKPWFISEYFATKLPTGMRAVRIDVPDVCTNDSTVPVVSDNSDVCQKNSNTKAVLQSILISVAVNRITSMIERGYK